MRTTLLSVILGVTLAATGIEPKITSVAPDHLMVSPKAQLLTVTGENFRTNLTLTVTTPGGGARTIGGADIAAQRSTSFQASVVLDAVGTYSLVVMNSDGRRSAPFPLDVKAAAKQPWISQVSPEEVPKGQEPQTITLTGNNFVTGLKVSVADPTGTVTVADAIDKVTADSVVLKYTFEMAGRYEIMLVNPSGESSNTVVVRVNF
jgi:IPT/TIG domain